MSFWETVLGNRLANVLITTLPKLAKSLNETCIEELMKEMADIKSELHEIKEILKEKKGN